MPDGRNRKDIKPGIAVSIILKQDQRTGKLTQGIVKDILTNSATPTASKSAWLMVRSAGFTTSRTNDIPHENQNTPRLEGVVCILLITARLHP